MQIVVETGDVRGDIIGNGEIDGMKIGIILREAVEDRRNGVESGNGALLSGEHLLGVVALTGDAWHSRHTDGRSFD